ncbi:hypothetical protein LWI28_011508 [Acer negundo]|uniref:F-box domain-containing protein n=1 Tax=Acer negundo TaxID=4023 RepID=A0AAD5IDE6_ACENE|nr:hypothetical protein LWI28_011508 [Acer negundo]
MEEKSVNLINKEADLPEPILHHIMSLLTMKEAVKASVLSKTWFKAWQTYPVLEFEPKTIKEDWYYHGRREKIFKFLDNSLRNREKHTDKYIHKFAIKLISLSCDREFASLIDRWVYHVVASNVKELKIAFALCGRHYTLPQMIFSAKSVHVLELSGCKLKYLPRNNRVELCSLKKLCLDKINVDDDVLENLIAGCPMIEDLSVYKCSNITSIELFGLDKLKEIKVKNNFELQRVEIGAANVQSVLISSLNTLRQIDIASCKNLKSLILDTIITDEWLSNQISELNQLEYLSVNKSEKLENIRISSLSLKTLIIHGSFGLNSIKIETPKLSEFTYDGKIVEFSSNALYLSEANLCISTNQFYSRNDEYIRFLGNFCHSKVVSVESSKDVIIPVELREIRNSPLFGVKHLNFNLLDSLHPFEICIPIAKILDGLLWIAPHQEAISIECGGNKSSFTFSYKKHLTADCCKSLPVSCWRHCVKEVEIVNARTLKEGEIVKRYLLQEGDIYEKIVALKDLGDFIGDL